MKIFMLVVLYFIIGIIIATIISKCFRINRGYSIESFDDLDSDEQKMMIVSLILWPIVIIICVIYFILDGITRITNRKDDGRK